MWGNIPHLLGKPVGVELTFYIATYWDLPLSQNLQNILDGGIPPPPLTSKFWDLVLTLECILYSSAIVAKMDDPLK